jgi:cytochrome c oxidase assembly factor CtaG
MAVTIGLAVTLSRSATPETGAPEVALLPATGEPLPPLPLTVGRAFTVTSWDVLWVLIVAALLVSYLRWVLRLRARGDRWSPGRTAAWVAGCVVLFWATNIGPTAYSEVLFSAHMLAHMILTMAVPPLLVIGAPVTLALRALPKRKDASRGLREWLLVLVHSRWATTVSSAPVAAVIFAGSIIVFYYTDLFGLALRTHLGHELMQVHFLASGYLYANALIGIDPGVKRPVYPVRLMILLGTMVFHSFFGVSLLSGESLLQASWFSSLGIGVDALEDQRTGGGIAWGIGEFPTVVMAIIMAVQWSKADEREARRTDRAADRDEDAQLHAYNAMLGRIGDQVQRDDESERASHGRR